MIESTLKIEITLEDTAERYILKEELKKIFEKIPEEDKFNKITRTFLGNLIGAL